MNDNYMKTILSGVKEWTENLTDDAKDKANNALDKANNALDKALYAVNITQNSDGTLSADKTFDEIVQAYNEGKYSIIAIRSNIVLQLVAAAQRACFFSTFQTILGEARALTVQLDSNNEITTYENRLALITYKLPNPYPLTFTGAVNETYDGSSAKTIEIPSGGGSAHEVIIASSTAGSTKKFKITVDDSGTITATEVV